MTERVGGAEGQRFGLAWTGLVDLYADRRFDDALAAAVDMERDFPDRRALCLQYQACLLSLTGRPDAALARMREVVDVGGWWAPRGVADPDLDAVRLAEGIREAGVSCRVRSVEGLGHVYPGALRGLVRDAVEFVLG